MLKKSLFPKTAEILGIEDVPENKKVVCRAFWRDFIFAEFWEKDFFNTHRRLHSNSAGCWVLPWLAFPTCLAPPFPDDIQDQGEENA